jgi:phosphatidylserine/phosphatidylglycerophosphate/cardiolipin synthase-like enzyme
METYVGRGAGAHIEKELFSAKDYALICSPWISSEFAKRIVQMVERGVQVRVITSNKKAGDTEKTLEILKDFAKPPRDLLGRVKKDWAPPPFDYKIIDEKFVHAKIYTVDGKYAITGSANLTESGLWHNVEHIVIMKNPLEVEKIENDYEHLWSFYEAKEIEDSSTNILRGLWKRVSKKMSEDKEHYENEQ